MLKFNSTLIVLCKYCGEYIGSTQKYCSTCKTQDSRKKIFDQNAEILKENKAKGFTVPLSLPNWK